jgi:hypothetical protein
VDQGCRSVICDVCIDDWDTWVNAAVKLCQFWSQLNSTFRLKNNMLEPQARKSST